MGGYVISLDQNMTIRKNGKHKEEQIVDNNTAASIRLPKLVDGY